MAQAPSYDPYEDEEDPENFWIPPFASFGNNASGAINNQNPHANPDQPFVQEGTTGGYIDGIGVTRGAGQSDTEESAKRDYDAAIARGVPEEWAKSLLARNPGDENRVWEAYQSELGGGGGGESPQSQTPTQQWNSQPPPVQAGPVAPPPAAAPVEPTATQVRSDELYKLLMQRAQQGTAVGREDPNVRAQVDPAAAQLERASRNSLDEIAEKAGPLANLTGERRLAGERVGQASAQLEAEVIGREIEGRRQEIMQALQMWGDQLSNDERIALTKELGYLDDAARTADRNQRGEQFSQGLAQDADQFTRGLEQSNSQFNLNLGQNSDQFMRELALREWDTGNKWDYNWASLGI